MIEVNDRNDYFIKSNPEVTIARWQQNCPYSRKGCIDCYVALWIYSEQGQQNNTATWCLLGGSLFQLLKITFYPFLRSFCIMER